MDTIERLRRCLDEILLSVADPQERRSAYIHLYGVAQSCALIALKRGVNVELAIVAGLLHDICSYVKMDTLDHARKSSVMAGEILAKLKIINDDEAKAVCEVIEHHSEKESAHSPLAEVLKDADSFQFWLCDPLVQPIDQSRKERCDKVMAELGITSTLTSSRPS